MPVVNQYRIYCETEAEWVYEWAEEEPTTCPHNTAHTILESSITIVDKEGVNPTDADGIPIVTSPAVDRYKNTYVLPQLAIGSGFRIATHNFCDKCTWWQYSTEQVDQTATDSGDHLTYNLADDYLIDIRHARLCFEDEVTAATVAPNGNTMTNIIPTVSVNDSPIAQSNEDNPSSNDRYVIDYTNGSVTFGVARQPSDTVTMSYRKAGSSKYSWKPAEGERLVLEDAELDMSESVSMTAPMVSTTYGSHTILTGGAIVPVEVRVYKVFHDFQASAREFYGPVPANFGGAGGIASPKWTFKWGYMRSEDIYYDACYLDTHGEPDDVTLNMVEMSIAGDVEFGGDFLTLTLYGSMLPEGGMG